MRTKSTWHDRTSYAVRQFIRLTISGVACSTVLLAQVRPLPQQPAPVQPRTQGVTPIPQRPPMGRVDPLPPAEPAAGTAEVFAIGVASVINGNATSARQAALQQAYAEAIGRGAGVEVGRLTIIKNVRTVTDMLAARTRGFVKSYDVISEGLVAGEPPRYEVRIKALVSTATSTTDDLDSLKLFLDVIGRPTILILLPDAEIPEQNQGDTTRIQVSGGTITSDRTPGQTRQPTPGLTALGGNAQGAGTMRMAEAAVAQAFSSYGYQVMTSDDLSAGGVATAEQVDQARRGVTTAALAVARLAGADLLLTGVLRISTQRESPQGVDFISATTVASAKALVVSNAHVVDAFQRTVTQARPSTLAAVSATIDRVGADSAGALAWKIPSILSSQPRVTSLVLTNVTLEMAQKIKAGLENTEGIDAVRFSSIPTAGRQTATLELLSSYVRLPQDEIVAICAVVTGKLLQISAADKFEIRLTVVV